MILYPTARKNRDTSRSFSIAALVILAGILATSMLSCAPTPVTDELGNSDTERQSPTAATVGEAGPVGAVGLDGPQGPQGDAGNAGEAGTIGNQGSPGNPGLGARLLALVSGAPTVAPGETATLDASKTRLRLDDGTGQARLIFDWTQIDNTGITVTMAGADTSVMSFVAPQVATPTLLEFQVVITAYSGELAIATEHVLVRPLPIDNIKLLGSSAQMGASRIDLRLSLLPYGVDGDVLDLDLSLDRVSLSDCRLTPKAGGAAVDVTPTITSFAFETGGDVQATIDFDSSGSMAMNDNGAVGRRAGGKAFFDRMDTNDRACLIDFGAGPDNGLEASRLLQDWTSDSLALATALNLLTEAGNTPLWLSAAHDACQTKMAEIGTTGGVIVLLTDGEDNASRGVMSDDLIGCANSRETAVYIVGLGEDLDYSELQDVAAMTGGAFTEAGVPVNGAELQDFFDALFDALKQGKLTLSATLDYPPVPHGIYTLQGNLHLSSGYQTVVVPFETTTQY